MPDVVRIHLTRRSPEDVAFASRGIRRRRRIAAGTSCTTSGAFSMMVGRTRSDGRRRRGDHPHLA